VVDPFDVLLQCKVSLVSTTLSHGHPSPDGVIFEPLLHLERYPMSTIEERVKKEEVTNSASFVDDLGADSLDTVELVMALEEEFECEIPDEEAEKISTVQAAIDYINAHVKA